MAIKPREIFEYKTQAAKLTKAEYEMLQRFAEFKRYGANEAAGALIVDGMHHDREFMKRETAQVKTWPGKRRKEEAISA
jgi:hypothetical protein